MAKKLTKPKPKQKLKTKTKTVAIPKTKMVRQQVAQPTQEKEPQNKPPILKRIKTIPPLPIQRSEYKESYF